MIPIPDKVSFEIWVGMFINSYPDFLIPVSKEEEKWREWAAYLLSTNSLSIPIPTQKEFPNKEDWRRWVRFSLQASPLL